MIDESGRHQRPPGTSDATVEAVGKVSEALEWAERARGSLYDFHQQMGHADQTLATAVDALSAAGHNELADRLRAEVVGRDALRDQWTFEIIEEFDDGYYASIRTADKQVRDALMAGRRHVFEAEMKAREQRD